MHAKKDTREEPIGGRAMSQRHVAGGTGNAAGLGAVTADRLRRDVARPADTRRSRGSERRGARPTRVNSLVLLWMMTLWMMTVVKGGQTAAEAANGRFPGFREDLTLPPELPRAESAAPASQIQGMLLRGGGGVTFDAFNGRGGGGGGGGGGFNNAGFNALGALRPNDIGDPRVEAERNGPEVLLTDDTDLALRFTSAGAKGGRNGGGGVVNNAGFNALSALRPNDIGDPQAEAERSGPEALSDEAKADLPEVRSKVRV